MPAKGKYWKRYWQKRSQAKEENVVSGWGNRDIKEYLYDLDDICKKLKLQHIDHLLNIGCGNGLMEMVLNYWVKEIESVDFSDGMIKRARINNANNRNVRFHIGNILNLSFLKNHYDKILCNSVMQYLNGLEEVAQIFEEIKKVSKKEVTILISANPNRSKMDEFLKGYDRLDIPEREKQKKKKINKMSLWTDPKEVAWIASSIGFKTKTLKMNPRIWQAWYMYDLLMWR